MKTKENYMKTGKFGTEIIAGIYIRVSSTEQAEEGYSIGSQTDKLNAYCKAMGYRIFNTYIDPGFTGANMNRPALQQLVQDIELNRLDVVIVMKLDRLSRSQKDTLYLIEDVFEKNNTSFISVTESFDTGTPMGKAFIGILAVFAQFERERIKERIQDGKMERAKSGKVMNWYKIPIGYDYDSENKTLIINKYEAQIVKRCFELYASGAAASHISDVLMEEFPTGTKYNKKNKRIPVTTIRRILENETYLGKVKYKDNVFIGAHEALVSEELFQKVQQSIAFRLEAASKTRKNPFRSTHLLTGFIKCGKCGARMHSQTRKHINNNKWFYICYGKSRAGKFYTENIPLCSSPVTDGESLDEMIISQIRQLKYDKDYYDKVAKHENEDEKPNLSEYIQKQIDMIDRKLNKLVDLYLSDSFDKDELEIRRNKLVEEKNILVKSLKKENNIRITRKDIMDALEDFESIFSGDDLSKKKNLLSLLIEEIYVYEDNVEVCWTF